LYRGLFVLLVDLFRGRSRPPRRCGSAFPLARLNLRAGIEKNNQGTHTLKEVTSMIMGKKLVISMTLSIGVIVLLCAPCKFLAFIDMLMATPVPTPKSPYATCESFISPTTGVRIAAHENYDQWLTGGGLLYYVTSDAGKSWNQFLTFRHDDPTQPQCENIKSLNPDFFWVWVGWKAAFTHDGGKTWTMWEPKDSWPDWECCNYSLIQDIEFEDSQTGYMTLHPIEGRGEKPLLQTQDGGKTWH
jgi:hypothetical protein